MAIWKGSHNPILRGLTITTVISIEIFIDNEELPHAGLPEPIVYKWSFTWIDPYKMAENTRGFPWGEIAPQL